MVKEPVEEISQRIVAYLRSVNSKSLAEGNDQQDMTQAIAEKLQTC